MREDLVQPVIPGRPLVGDVEAIDGAHVRQEDRDEAIIKLLRKKLKDRSEGNTPDTPPRRRATDKAAGEEDKYEPQRINRKICWQYDSSARKVPLLRRHYI